MTDLPTLSQIEAAAKTVYAAFDPTPQYRWATLSQRLGTDCWVKHENHTPVGAFKVRGGLTYFEHLQNTQRLPKEVISATRGNHGQSIAYAAARHGVACTIVVPRENSIEKNTAMRALGAPSAKNLLRWMEPKMPCCLTAEPQLFTLR
jgi:threonine dehydratase